MAVDVQGYAEDFQTGDDSKKTNQVQTPSFLNSVLGNIGEPFMVWGEDEDDEDFDISDLADGKLDYDIPDSNGV